MFEFLAVGWIAMGCIVVAIYLPGNMRRGGFSVMMSGNACESGVHIPVRCCVQWSVRSRSSAGRTQ